MHKKDNWERTISFEKELVIVKEGMLETINLPYTDIISVQEKENQVKILFQNKIILRLYKDCFIQSDWNICKEFLQKTTSVAL